MGERDRLEVRFGGLRSSRANATNSRFEMEIAEAMCSSEEFGQEHTHLPAVRAQGAVAGDTVIWAFLALITKTVGIDIGFGNRKPLFWTELLA